MMLGTEVVGGSSTTQLIITTLGALLVAGIGYLGNRAAKKSKEEAASSATSAADYAAALGARKDQIEALVQRVQMLVDDNARCEERCDKLEKSLEAAMAQLTDMMAKIEALTQEVERLKAA